MLIYCVECGKQISDEAVACPHCGKKKANATKKQSHVLSFILILLIIIIVLSFF